MERGNGQIITIKTRTIVNVVLILLLVLALYYIRDILFVFLTSIVIASFVEAGVKRLQRHKIGRTIAVILIYFLALGILGTLFYLFVPVFLEETSHLSSLFDAFLPNTNGTLSIANQFSFSDAIKNLDAITSNSSTGIVQTAILLFGGIFNFVLLVVLSFYLSINKGSIESFLRIIIPSPEEDYAVDLWRRVERKIGLWFQGQLLLGLLIGVLTYLGLLIFNVKYALLLALAAAVFELIPFGIILAAIPAVISGFSTSGVIGAVEVTALYVIIQQFENNLIQPLILKKVVGISSLVVILALLIGVKLAGFWGVMLAIPGAVFMVELLNDIEKKKKRTT